MQANVIDIREHPNILGVATANEVVGRTVLDWSPYCGSYGNGSPGFLGFKLSATDKRPVEWLLLTLYRAAPWLVISDCWLMAHPEQYDIKKPLVGGQGEDGWDDFTGLVVKRRIDQFVVMRECTILRVGGTLLGITPDPASRPPHHGTGMPRALGPDEDLRNAWVLAERACVMV